MKLFSLTLEGTPPTSAPDCYIVAEDFATATQKAIEIAAHADIASLSEVTHNGQQVYVATQS